ncbi:MAG: acyl-CoA dehydrogenase family protein [Nitrososphaerota archaeon]
MSAEANYLLLMPEHKYPRCFCTEEEVIMAKRIREFVDKEVLPNRQNLEGGWHRDEELAHKTLFDLYYKCHQLGLTISNLPSEYGGLALSPIVRYMINEELSRGDVGLATLVGKTHWIASFMYNRVQVREDLLEEFAPKLTSNVPYITCVNISEPEGGANIEDPALELRTLNTVIAKKEGDFWVLNGHKIWPGPAADPSYWDRWHEKWPDKFAGHLGYWVVVTEDPSRGEDAAGMVYHPYNAEGVRFGLPYKKCGLCWTDENVEIWYENVKVPAKYRVDVKPGNGAKIIHGYVIGPGRLAAAARLTGIATACLEIALEWTKSRQIAGKPVRERSYFASILADMYRMVDLARQYYLSVTWQLMHPEIYGESWEPHMLAKFSTARSFAGEAAMFCANKAMELMSSYGYVFEMNLEKYYRDFKIVQMWLGGAQRDRLDIAQGLYGPFKWAGYEDWLRARWPKKFADLKNIIEKEIDKTLNRTSGSEKEAEKIRKELSRDMEYDIDEATKG